MLSIKQNKQRGVSLVEAILALSILSILTVVVFQTMWSQQNGSLGSARAVAAVNISNTKLFAQIAGEPVDVPNVLGIENTLVHKPFSRCAQSLNSESVWSAGWRTKATTSMSLIDVDLELADRLGFDCGGATEVSAQSLTNPETFDLGLPATSIDLVGDKAFVSLNSTGSSDPDLVIVDLNSHHKSFIDSGAGINKIDATQDYVFAAAQSSTTQVAIFDVNSKILVATSTLPGVTGSRPEAVSIFYLDSKLYVGTKRTAGHEFHIFDVTNPAQPIWIGSREVNHNINDIYVKDGFAFLATSGNVRDLIVLDVRNPAAITQVSEVDLLGNEDGRSMYVVQNQIYLGRHKSTVPGRNELFVLEYELTQNGDFVGTRTITSAATGAEITSLVFAGGKIYVGTKNSLLEFQVFDFDAYGNVFRSVEFNQPYSITGIDVEDGLVGFSAGNNLYLLNN